MRACEMANLPGLSIAITSMCTTNSERFDKIRTCTKRYFESERLEIVFRLL